MTIPGYAGKILYVDLTSGNIRSEPLDLEMVKRFIGGWGINHRLAYDLVPPQCDPLSPENAIILGTGPFPGTIIPASSRLMVTYKAPLNGTFTTSVGGGHFSAMLKSSGFDHAFITGRADKPVYLKFHEHQAEICDARDLWGKDIYETVDELRNRHEPCSVIAIGPAGENLVRVSITTIDKGGGTVGQGGLPAAMGAKNLKAMVAVQGTHPIKVADRRALHRLVDEMLGRIISYPMREGMLKGGSMFMTAEWRGMGFFVKNWSELAPLPSREAIKATLERHMQSRKPISCTACPMCDKDRVDITEGEYAGKTFYDSAMMAPQTGFGPLGSTAEEYGRSLTYIDLTNRYGIDRLQVEPMISLMAYLYQQGLIGPADTHGLELREDFETKLKLQELIAYRKGFGDVMAEGVLGAVRRLGRGLERYAVHIKGYTRQFDPRVNGLGTGEFAALVSPRGAVFVPGAIGSPSYNPGRPVEEWVRQAEREGFSQEAIKRIFGADSFNVGRATRYAEDWYSLHNCLGLCHRLYLSRFFHIRTITPLFNALTGLNLSSEELLRAAERTWNLHKAINVRAGFSRKDDEPPDKWFEPLKGLEREHRITDYYGKTNLTREDVDLALDDYYDERGWNKKTSAPTPQKLRELGLEKVAQDMEKAALG